MYTKCFAKLNNHPQKILTKVCNEFIPDVVHVIIIFDMKGHKVQINSNFAMKMESLVSFVQFSVHISSISKIVDSSNLSICAHMDAIESLFCFDFLDLLALSDLLDLLKWRDLVDFAGVFDIIDFERIVSWSLSCVNSLNLSIFTFLAY